MASSEAGVMERGKMTAWERWEMAALAEAREEEESVAAAAEAERNTGHAHGYAEGLEQGRRAGQAQVLAAAKAEAARMAAVAGAAQAALDALAGSLAERTVGLALALARQVLREELSARPEAILTVVRDALTQLPEPIGSLHIHVNPHDAPLVQSSMAEDIARGGWRVVPDPGVAAGGCHLSAAAGDVDATLATRWKNVLTSLGLPANPKENA
jgi:flagellar assembly protein FliH